MTKQIFFFATLFFVFTSSFSSENQLKNVKIDKNEVDSLFQKVVQSKSSENIAGLATAPTQIFTSRKKKSSCWSCCEDSDRYNPSCWTTCRQMCQDKCLDRNWRDGLLTGCMGGCVGGFLGGVSLTAFIWISEALKAKNQ